MRFTFVILLVLAFARMTNLDIALVQGGAWTQMLCERAEYGIQYAWRTTFSGELPCARCLHVEQERRSRGSQEDYSSRLKKELKLPLAEDFCLFSIFSVPFGKGRGVYDLYLRSLYDAEVPTPPPRESIS